MYRDDLAKDWRVGETQAILPILSQDEAAGTGPQTTDEHRMTKPKSDLGPWVTQFGEAWAEIVKGEPHYGMIGRTLKPLVAKYGSDRLYAPWREYLRENARWANPARFVQSWGQYERLQAPVGPLVDEWGCLTFEGDILTRPK